MNSLEDSYIVESDSKSAYIAEQFAENSPDELDFQYLSEVYSVLVEFENYDGEEEQRLMNHIDEFADEIITETSADGPLNAEEVAEQVADFLSRESEATREDLVMKYTRIYLGDRLRLFERSQHSK